MMLALFQCQAGNLRQPGHAVPVPRLTIAARAGTEAMKGNTMFDGALGAVMAIGVFVLVIALIYAVLHIRHHDMLPDRETGGPNTDARAQRDNLKYQAGVGTMATRPHSPRPNDIT